MNGYPRDMFDEMDETFGRLFSRMHEDMMAGEPAVYGYRIVIQGPDYPGSAQETPPAIERASATRKAEVHRVGDEVMVIAELPGTTLDSVRLDLKGQTLFIDANGPEIPYHATADLPPVDEGSMQTSCRNGVLEVTFRILPHNPEKSG